MSDRAPAVLGGVPFLADLPLLPSWPQHGADEEAALLEVLRSDRWGSTHGDVVETFEREFAAAERRALVERLGQPLVEPERPVADEVSADTLWLPQHVLLGSTEQIRAVATAIAAVVAAADRLP